MIGILGILIVGLISNAMLMLANCRLRRERDYYRKMAAEWYEEYEARQPKIKSKRNMWGT